MKLPFLPALAGLILTTGGVAMAATPKATLPLVIYSEAGGKTPYIPSGYMGNVSAIKMDPQWTTNSHTGRTCLKVSYTTGKQWGGVVWQNPANNWGDKPGGFNLTGAKTLSFWARGDKGGEKVTFLFGLVGKGKPNADSGTGKLDGVSLTKQWKPYVINLRGKNLSQVITGFAWTLAASGSPETFYLDDVKYQ